MEGMRRLQITMEILSVGPVSAILRDYHGSKESPPVRAMLYL